MPATEQTWRDQRVLNAVFGASALVMLFATVWMLWSDHDREWKPYQRKFREVEARVASWRIQEQQTLAFEQSERQLLANIAAAKQVAPPREALEQLLIETLYHPLASDPSRAAIVQLYDSYRIGKLPAEDMIARLREVGVENAGGRGEASLRAAVVDRIDQLLNLQEAQPADVQSAKDKLINALDRLLRVVRFNETRAAGMKKFAVADQAVKDSNFGMGVRDSVDDAQLAELQQDFEAEEARVAALDLDVQRLNAYRKALEASRKRLLQSEDEAAQALAAHRSDLSLLEKISQDKFGGWGRAIARSLLELPIIDAFGRPLKIDQIWLPELTQDFNFKRVARFDRCTTCHLGMDKTAAGSAVEPAYPASHPVQLTFPPVAADPRVTAEERAAAVVTAAEAAETAIGSASSGKDANSFGAVFEAIDSLAAAGASLAELSPLLSDETRDGAVSKLAAIRDSAAGLAGYLQNDVVASGELRGRLEKLDLAASGIRTTSDPLPGVYGLKLAAQGLLQSSDIVVAEVTPGGLAAQAGVLPGDTVTHIGDSLLKDAADVPLALVTGRSWKEGETLAMTVVRGLPQPFASHPRLDLFVGSVSPHKMMEMGCTVCHEGQGSATEFKYASHTPNTPGQRKEWAQKYGWYDNHHWIYPMTANRFTESTCLKCHHGVVELEPSEKFPEPPAPKLMAGYHLIREYGCFGCHEINGYDGPNRRVGPDMRLEPNYAAVAQALLADTQLTDEEKQHAAELVSRPENDVLRRGLRESLLTAARGTADEPARVSADTAALADALADVESPGKMRKVGPSLRYVAKKLDPTFLYRWLENTKDFRPTTKMPNFFGQHDHLTDAQKGEARELEDVEIRAITSYLLAKSQSFAYDEIPAAVTEQPSAERGKTLFQTRCLACHSHADFPKATADQGPDLSRIGGKLKETSDASGAKWLYTWLRNPSKYHARTFMPEMKLELATDAEGKVSDMAADVAAYLLASNDGGWSAAGLTPWGQQQDARLDELVYAHLRGVVDTNSAEKFVKQGIPAELAGEFRGDERELLGEPSASKKLVYLGKRTIGKYGCYACHDIPGFETAKPIGAALADWGRKDPSRIAFEHIAEYLHKGLQAHGSGGAASHGGQHPSNGAEHTAQSHGTASNVMVRNVSVETPAPSSGDAAPIAAMEGSHAEHHEIDTVDLDPSVGYFVDAINGHNRIGFLWQKLREPRSYDFRKVENKPYNDRLRMPKFNFNQEQIESVMTFVLGLVADPPANKYQYKGDARRKAELEGLAVLQKYNCSGCHQLTHEKWTVAYSPEEIQDPAEIVDYEFLKPKFTEAELRASAATTRAGLIHATVSGRPVLRVDGQPELVDIDYLPLEPDENGQITSTDPMFYQFVLWKHAAIGGKQFRASDKLPIIRTDRLLKQSAPWGGDLGRWIYADVLGTERVMNPSADKDQAWGWLPPPLMGEGDKVRPSWLHDYLLQPYAIRPAAILRMPKFNMSSEEAGKLVNYFAAVSGAEFPYVDDARTSTAHLDAAERAHPGHLNGALNIVTSSDYCVKCHIVADYSAVGKPTAFGTDKAAGPDLSKVYERLRPEFMQRWIANPKVLLPYTGMPVNIPVDKPVAQTLYEGDSHEQLGALVDLLSNFDQFARSQTKISGRVKPATAPASSDNPSGAAPQEGASGNQANNLGNPTNSSGSQTNIVSGAPNAAPDASPAQQGVASTN